MITQFQVNDAAITGRHGFEYLTATGLHGLVGHTLRHLAQLAFVTRPITLHINDYLHPVFHLLADDQIDDILQGVLDDIQDPSSPDRMGFVGIKEIRKAIEAFTEANKHLLTYDPDFTTCVLLERSEPKQ